MPSKKVYPLQTDFRPNHLIHETALLKLIPLSCSCIQKHIPKFEFLILFYSEILYVYTGVPDSSFWSLSRASTLNASQGLRDADRKFYRSQMWDIYVFSVRSDVHISSCWHFILTICISFFSTFCFFLTPFSYQGSRVFPFISFLLSPLYA